MSGKENVKNIKLRLVYPSDGETICLANDEIAAWFKNYKRRNVGENYGKGDHFVGKNPIFKWTCDCDDKSVGYVVTVKEAGADGEGRTFETKRIKGTKETSLEVAGLAVNSDYVWSVKAIADGRIVAESEGRFGTEKTPAFVDAEGVSNIRDVSFFSKTLKRGMLFRSAAMENATEKGLAVLSELGIKTDIDLRMSGEGHEEERSPIPNAKYFSYSGAYYVKSGAELTDPVYQANMAKAFEVFADESNYPIVFHCAIGRDRTGTLAAIVEAFLGASAEDIFADYEVSFFTEAGCRDNADPAMMTGKITEVYDFLMGYSSGNLAENTEKFLLDIGVKQFSLDKFRRIMTKNKNKGEKQ